MSTKTLNQEIENIDSDLSELSKLELLCERDTVRTQLATEVNRLTLRRNKLVKQLTDSSDVGSQDRPSTDDEDKDDLSGDLSSGISKLMDGNSEQSDDELKDKSLLLSPNVSLSPSSVKEEGYGSEEKSEHTPSSTTSHQTFSRFSRGSGRLSMAGNQLDVWVEAADRQLTRSINRKEKSAAAKEVYKHYNSLPKHMNYGSSGGKAGHRLPLSSSVSSDDALRHRDDDRHNNNHHNNGDDTKTSVIVVLAKESGPLGIHVVSENGDEVGYCNGLLVQGIEPGGRIDRDGRLHVGDAIVEINGQSILEADFESAQRIFRSALQTDEIALRLMKYNQNAGNNQTVASSSPRRPCPPPVLPKPATVMRQHEQLRLVEGMVEGEERAVQPCKVATVTSTKKLTPTIAGAHKPAVSSALCVANTRKIGKKYHIQLKKGADGLGFSITTRDNPTGGNVPIYIKNILSNGAAVEDGRLKTGDRLLEVCGIEMTGKSQSEAVNILRTLPLGTSVDLIVSRQEVDASPSPMMPRRLPPEKSADTAGNEREVLTFEIPLNDTGSAGLGVSMKGKTTTATGVHSDLGIFVKSVIHGGAASKDGRLKTNDQLININGIPLLGMSNSQAMETLRRAMILSEGPIANPNAITVTIARKSSATASAPEVDNSCHQRNDSLLSATSNDSCNEESFSVNNSRLDDTYDSYRSPATAENTVIYRPKNDGQVSSSSSNSKVSQSVSSPTEKSPPKTPTNSQPTNRTFLKQFYLSENHDSNRIYDKTPNVMNRSDVIIERDDCVENGAIHRTGVGVGGSGGGERSESMTESTPRDSQLSLAEDDEGFRRDGFGRQSMSEKRHAQLDAKSTDTYRRSKKAKEEKERQLREQQQEMAHKRDQSVNGYQTQQPVNTEPKHVVPHELVSSSLLNANQRSTSCEFLRLTPRQTNSCSHTERKCRSPGSCPYHTVRTNANNHTRDVGPGLGMRKSSSLESLQTMMQDIQKEQLETVNPFTTPRPSTVRVSRSRETNESFRAAVDRSYDANNDNENHETMETVAEEDSDSDGSSVENIPHKPRMHHTQAILVRPSGALSMASTQYTATTGTSSQMTTEDETQGFLSQKKKSGGKKKRLLKTWFKFGSKKGRSSDAKHKAEREGGNAGGGGGSHQQPRDQMSVHNAQQLYLMEQERIHMHYKRLMEQQQQQQHLQHQQQQHHQQQQQLVSHTAQPTPPIRQRSKSAVGERFGAAATQPMHSTPTGATTGQLANHELNADGAMSRNERMAQLRAQHQRMHLERQRVYPNEQRLYDTYSSMDRKHQSDYANSPNYSSTQMYISYPINANYPPSPRRLVSPSKSNAFERRAQSLRSNAHKSPKMPGVDAQHSRGNSYDIYRQMERPGSRVGIADHNNKYSHYMNYREIQQQMHHYHQQQQQQHNVNHYSDYEIYVPPVDADPPPKPMVRSASGQHQRHVSSPLGARQVVGPQPHDRPHYYEYETATAVLKAKQQLIQQQNNVNNNVSPQKDGPSGASLTRRSKKYAKPSEMLAQSIQASSPTSVGATGTSIQVPSLVRQQQPIYQTNQLKIYGSTYSNGYSSHSQPPQNPPASRIYDTIHTQSNSNAIHDSNGYDMAAKYQNVRPGSKV